MPSSPLTHSFLIPQGRTENRADTASRVRLDVHVIVDQYIVLGIYNFLYLLTHGWKLQADLETPPKFQYLETPGY